MRGVRPLAGGALVWVAGPGACWRASGEWPTASRISRVLWDLQGFVYLQAQVVIGPENQGGLGDGRGSEALAGKAIGSCGPPLQLWLSERDRSDQVVLGNHPISVMRNQASFADQSHADISTRHEAESGSDGKSNCLQVQSKMRQSTNDSGHRHQV